MNKETPGWIKLHRKIFDWEWYDDINTWRLFIHCLLKANFEDKHWHGTMVKRGSFITVSLKLAEETHLSRQQVRTALNKLKSTNELTIKTSRQFTKITVNNYDKYQQNNQRITNEQPTNNQQITTTKEYKKDKKEKNILSKDNKDKSKQAFGNKRVNFVYNAYKQAFGEPVDKRPPRQVAWNIVKITETFMREFGKEVGDDNQFKTVIMNILKRLAGEDWSVQSLDTVRRHAKRIYSLALKKKGGE